MVDIEALDAHERPPESIRKAFKIYRKLQLFEIDSDARILDLQRLDADALPDGLYLDGWLSGESLSPILDTFMNRSGSQLAGQHESTMDKNIPIYMHHAVPGQRRKSPMYEVTKSC